MALVVGAPQAVGGSRPPLDSQKMAVTASSHAARAHRVRLTLTLTYEMQCGYPGVGPLVATFPSALKLPARFAADSVRLAGKPIAASVEGRQVTVTIPPPAGMLCDTIGIGSVALTFTPGAKLTNPARAGSYDFKATHGKRAFAAKLAIKRPS